MNLNFVPNWISDVVVNTINSALPATIDSTRDMFSGKGWCPLEWKGEQIMQHINEDEDMRVQ